MPAPAPECRWLTAAASEVVPTNLDVIIVLGGGQDASRASGLPEAVERRAQVAIDVLAQQSASCKVLCSGGGVSQGCWSCTRWFLFWAMPVAAVCACA